MHGESLRNWFPIKLLPQEEPHLCQWMFMGDKKFTEPFFDETILWCKSFRESKEFFKSTSSLEMLQLWSGDIESIQPTAFIFHVSRCGSTLLSQLLSLEARHIVLSEVPFLDELLRLPFNEHHNLTVEQSDYHFREAIRFYGQMRNTEESQLFIKLDSWHLLFYDRIRNLYPNVPFLILYRSPADIIRSQKRARGMQSVPGLIEREIFGFTEPDFTPDLDLYMSRVLEKYFGHILRIIKTDSNFLLADYDEGIFDITQQLLSLSGIQPTEQHSKKMKERLEFDGKRPSFFFSAEERADTDVEFLQPAQALYHRLNAEKTSLSALKNKLHQQL